MTPLRLMLSFVLLGLVAYIGFPAVKALAGNEPAATAPAPAPNFTGIDRWLNSEPLSIEKLRGKVVLVEFWTYECINCIHVIPHTQALYDRYRNDGLVVVGIHTPEYDEERIPSNVVAAVKQLGITYPVALDNGNATWDAYGNQYWPALYLIDQQGRIVYRNVGEGNYAYTEARIRQLLGKP
jgi:thiol-disulfide isomerase/thioredoxin